MGMRFERPQTRIEGPFGQDRALLASFERCSRSRRPPGAALSERPPSETALRRVRYSPAMERPRLYVLSNEAWEVGLLPETGMSTAFGRIQHGDGFIDFMRPTPVDAYAERVLPDCANYLLIPWSNRIRDARFVFRGVTHQLRVNFPDGTAMHGTAKDFPWEVLVAHPTHSRRLSTRVIIR